MTTIVVLGYLLVAAYVGVSAFAYGFVLRPRIVAFGGLEHTVLALTAFLVGLFWPAFMPALLARAWLLARRLRSRKPAGSWIFPWARTARART